MNILKKILFFAILITIIFITAFSIYYSQEPEGLPSTELTMQEITEGNLVRMDYVDADGQVTYATDKHYATIVKTCEDGRVILEEYLDAEGKPAVLTSGYCAISKSYNADGLTDVITYLGSDGAPVMTTSGYSSIHRTYNDQRLVETDSYYNTEEKPVQHLNGYYAFRRDYDDRKRVNRITYLGIDGLPVNCKAGYAQEVRSFNEAGKIEYEYYYDAAGSPAKASQGQYGVYKEYNEEGRVTLTTYLDPDGNPMTLKSGYATTVHSYAPDGSLESIRYYDSSGNPVTSGRNRYGVKYQDGQVYYLDNEGNQTVRLDHLLNKHPEIVLISGVLLTIMAMLLKGKSRVVFLILYILFIGMMTMWYREPGEARDRFELFWSYRQFFISASLREEILNNIWLFMPLGAGLYKRGSWWRWMFPVLLSVAIEAVQYYTGFGLCELDDVVSNSLGGFIGYGLASAFLRKHRRTSSRGVVQKKKTIRNQR